MEISDTDILAYDSLEVDMSMMNVTRLNMSRDGLTVHSIPVTTKEGAFKLMQQIESYRKELEVGRDKEESSGGTP